MSETKLVYKGLSFENPEINPVQYSDEYFQLELDLESDLFYELRKANNIEPHKINESSAEELNDIRNFFNKNKESFFFQFEGTELIGSILCLNNYIQSLCIAKKYQRKGYATKLVKFAVSKILANGFNEVTLKVLDGNFPAINLYKKLRFKIAD